MHRITNPNIEIIEAVVGQLGDLSDRLVFLGGCATGLLLTDVAAPPIRYTHDVDVITEVGTLAEYYGLSDQLRQKGFLEDSGEDAPICRWKSGELLLDVMPTNPELLGFGSVWYQEAVVAAQVAELAQGKRIRLITAPYFLACKFDAFDSRGNGDYLMSHDMEDIVAVIDGRPEVLEEVRRCSGRLQEYLVRRFQEILSDNKFREALHGHMPGDEASQARVTIILERIKGLAKL